MSGDRWKTSLDGSGTLAWDVSPPFAAALAAGDPLPPETLAPGLPLAVGKLAGRGKLSCRGGETRFNLSAEAAPAIVLTAFPPGSAHARLKALALPVPLPADRLAVILELAGDVEGDFAWRRSASGGTPILRAGADLEAKAGAALRLGRVLPVSTPAPVLLGEVLSFIRLPHAAAGPAHLLPPGSAVSLTRRGALKLSAFLKLPFGLAGPPLFPGAPAALLTPDAALGLEGACQVKGHVVLDSVFTVLARPSDRRPGCLEAAFRRERERESGLGVVLEAVCAVSPGGEGGLEIVLGALLGTAPARILSVLAGLAEMDREDGNPATALAAVLAETALDGALARLRDAVLPGAAREAVAEAAGAFLHLDERLQECLWSAAGEIPALARALHAAVGAGRAANLAVALLAASAGGVFPADSFFPAEETLAAGDRLLQRLLAPGKAEVLDAVLREILGRERALVLLERLAALATADGVAAVADGVLRRLAAGLLAVPLAELSEPLLRKAGKTARKVLNRLQGWDGRLAGALGGLFSRKWSMEASLEYLRRRSEDSLAEFLFDPTAPGAAEALARAAGGEPGDLLVGEAVPGVTPLRAVFQRALQTSATFRLRLGALGWAALDDLASSRTLRIVPDGEAWSQALTVGAEGRVARERPGKETLESDFRLTLVSRQRTASPGPVDCWSFPSARADYRLTARDPVADAGELAALLAYAPPLGLLGGRSPETVAERLLGVAPEAAVNLVYRVKVPEKAFAALAGAAFPPAEAEEAVLEVLAWCWLRYGGRTHWLRRVGGAVGLVENRSAFARRGRLRPGEALALLGPAQGLRRTFTTPLKAAETAVLEATYRLAREAGETVAEFLAAVGPGGGETCPANRLEALARRLAGVHNGLAGWGGPDVLPHVLFRLAGRRAGLDFRPVAALEATVAAPGAAPVTVVFPSARPWLSREDSPESLTEPQRHRGFQRQIPNASGLD